MINFTSEKLSIQATIKDKNLIEFISFCCNHIKHDIKFKGFVELLSNNNLTKIEFTSNTISNIINKISNTNFIDFDLRLEIMEA